VSEPGTATQDPFGQEPAPPPPSGGSRWRVLAPVAVIAVIVLVTGIAVAATSGGSKQALPNNVHQVKKASFEGAVASPELPAPPLALSSYLGQPVNIKQYRGKVVLVTFLYANCPTLCPVIAANLHAARDLMGPQAAHVQLLAVSVDPHHDTPKAVAGFLKAHGLTGGMQYLIGNAHQLGRVWTDWNVGSEADASQPDLINHSGLVYGVAASGKLITLYPGNFTPAQIVHDIPGLLAS
jgi:protein SCO1/2